MRLLLVRHGQTPSNVAHRLDTALPGPGLTDLGREQAAALPAACEGEPIDAVWASAARRAQETAAPLARDRGLDVVVRDGLREVDAGDLEMRDDVEAQREYLGAVFAWAAGDTSVRLPGAESGDAALGRVDAAIAELVATGARCALVVSHGGTIRMWVAARAENVEVAWAADNPLLNTGVVVLEGDPDTGWRALSYAGAPVAAPAGADGPAAQPLAEDPAGR